jgi:hypothetical protein
MDEKKGTYRVLVGKSERKKLHGTPRLGGIIFQWLSRKWNGGLDWRDVAQGRGK